MMYLLASYSMVYWYYNIQQARGLSNKTLTCFAMSAVLGSAYFTVADLAARLWLMLSASAEASQAVSFSFCLTWCTTSLHVRNVLNWPDFHWCNTAQNWTCWLQGLMIAAAACASWAAVATAWRVWQSIRVRAGTRSQPPELNTKEAEHFAGALDQAELRAFYNRLAPNSQAAQLAMSESRDQSIAGSAPSQSRHVSRANFRRSQLAASRPKMRNQGGRQQKARNQQTIQRGPAHQSGSSRS